MLNTLWTPTTVGGTTLPHRLVMASLTRDHSTPEGVPTELNAEYYAQRASNAAACIAAGADGVGPATFYGGGAVGYTDYPMHTG